MKYLIEQAVEASRRPGLTVQLHALAGQVLSHQLHLAAQLPRNYIVDQTKCASFPYIPKAPKP